MIALDFKFANVYAYLPLQIFTATFHTNENVIMLSQFMCYKLKNQKEKCKIRKSVF